MPRKTHLRTEDVVVHEQLGLALGRLAVADTAFRDALTRGYSLALREQTVGRRPDRDGAVAELDTASRDLARVHNVRPRARRRKAA